MKRLFIAICVIASIWACYKGYLYHTKMPDFRKDYVILTNGQDFKVKQRQFLYRYTYCFMCDNKQEAERRIERFVKIDQDRWRSKHEDWSEVK